MLKVSEKKCQKQRIANLISGDYLGSYGGYTFYAQLGDSLDPLLATNVLWREKLYEIVMWCISSVVHTVCSRFVGENSTHNFGHWMVGPFIDWGLPRFSTFFPIVVSSLFIISREGFSMVSQYPPPTLLFLIEKTLFYSTYPQQWQRPTIELKVESSIPYCY